MTRVCTVCAHQERHSIDTALATGAATFRNIAERWGLSTTAVFRHRAEHLPAALVKAAGAEEVRQALDVLQQLKFINAAALTVLRDAKTAGDGDLMLKAVDRVHRQVELQAKLLGDLDDRPQINVLVSPEWVQLRGQIVQALAPYPEAAVAVAGVLAC